MISEWLLPHSRPFLTPTSNPGTSATRSELSASQKQKQGPTLIPTHFTRHYQNGRAEAVEYPYIAKQASCHVDFLRDLHTNLHRPRHYNRLSFTATQTRSRLSIATARPFKMLKPDLQPLVYAQLFPYPGPGDPQSFAGLISRHLIPEVRAETMRFYGGINCIEAQYPGLDYTSPGHRLRLSYYTWHRRLFRVFDAMELTDHEIYTFCRWEGTKYARARYERDTGTVIRETTWDGIEVYESNPRPTSTPYAHSPKTKLRGGKRSPSISVAASDTLSPTYSASTDETGELHDHEEEVGDDDNEDLESEDDDLLAHSVGTALNQRLLAATAARARGEDVVLDPDWEQWMKEAAERGGIPVIPDPASATGAAPASASATATAHRALSSVPGVFRWELTPPQSLTLVEGSQRALRHYARHPPQPSSSSSSPLQMLRPASRLRPRGGAEVLGGQS